MSGPEIIEISEECARRARAKRIAHACAVMGTLRELEVRHLPVLHGGKLVGLLSQRDLDFLGATANVDPEHTPVSEAMSSDTYAVGSHETLRRVAAAMADHHYGSAVVVDHGRVIGIFTTVDALGALSTLLASPAPVAL